ncbi:MAG: hypothetical protein AAF219_07245 [Myxococcota bacterium]
MENKTYRVLLRGNNVWLDMDGTRQRYGFYTTLVVVTPNPEMAETLAVTAIRAELMSRARNDSNDPCVVVAERVDETGRVELSSPGISFFRESSL